jgi:uncharacterized secreted protein with C-terminal beta-propeller domain
MNPMIKIALLSLPLVACGGGSSSNQPKPKVNTDYSKLSASKLEPGSLREASADELSELVKNGLRVSLSHSQDYHNMLIDTVMNDINSLGESKSGGDFSGTNVQVANVDEADSVKYDGKYIYLATPVTYSDTGANGSLKIFATDADNASVSELSDTSIATENWGGTAEMYLVSNAQGTTRETTDIATVRRSMDIIALADTVSASLEADGKLGSMNEADAAQMTSLPYFMDSGIEISLFDVRTPSAPAKSWSLSLDGNLLGTRKIGNILYVVSSFIPGIIALDYAAETEDEKIANETLITNTPVEKLLPSYSINGGSPQSLVDSSGCMIPASTSRTEGHLNLVNITAIDLSTKELIKSVCVNSEAETIYVSSDNIYLVGSDYSRWENWQTFTVVHRFALDQSGASYSATGSVEGTLGWSSPSFRMDEYQNSLRMITTTYDAVGEPIHHLNILQKVDGRSELEVVAQLPNQDSPEAIGKPREEIYAARFNGDKVYIVTFERKDPLYVLDLANPLAPKIAGQLEVPGFSSYLHPIGDNYLFALGNDATSDGVVTGVKVALYDIRNPANPTEIGQHVFGGTYSWSAALYDHHALSFLTASDDQIRITLPISLFAEEKTGEFIYNPWVSSGLYQFEINGLTGDKLSLDHVGQVISESHADQLYPLWDGSDRGILHGDSLFYVHGPKVIATPWSSNQ